MPVLFTTDRSTFARFPGKRGIAFDRFVDAEHDRTSMSASSGARGLHTS